VFRPAKSLKVKELLLYLASGSPRRLELLRQIGLDPRRVAHTVRESPEPGETPTAHVGRLAAAKAQSALGLLAPGAPPGVVLAADTVVTIDGEILGKPESARDAERMLRSLRGRVHQVLTGVSLARTDDARSVDAVEATQVRFRRFDDDTIRAYVASGEPLDKAGSYGIQGLGAFLSVSIEGSWSNVVGLPLERLPECLAGIGVDPGGLFRGRLFG